MFFLAIKGLFIGMANVIPGVSGGTLAVVFNIYDKFVNAITPNIKKLIANWKFIVPLFGGMALGVLLFSKLIKILYTNYPLQTNYCFTGLILGSIPMLFKATVKKYNNEEKISTKNIILIIVGIICGIALILLFNYLDTLYSGKESGIVFELPPITLKQEIIIFLAGILGAVAMIIPGISGSLLMLILGVYPIVMTAIDSLLHKETFLHSLFLLLPNGIGVLIGIVCGAKLISFLLKKWPNITYAVILGLICGSAYTLFPGFSQINTFITGLSCALSLILGFAMAFLSSYFTKEEK